MSQRCVYKDGEGSAGSTPPLNLLKVNRHTVVTAI